MGYTTDFRGKIYIQPLLNSEEIKYLTEFSLTRRVNRKEGSYYVIKNITSTTECLDTEHLGKVINFNDPPEGQPGLWCQWIPTRDGDAIVWDEVEKFYHSAKWMLYLIQHFLGKYPLAKSKLPFLQGHILRGRIEAQGGRKDDRWMLIVQNNVVTTEAWTSVPSGNSKFIGSGD